MKKGTIFAIIAGTAAITAAAIAVVAKKKHCCTAECCYDAGDLQEDDCSCECDFCEDDLGEVTMEEMDEADAAEAAVETAETDEE